MGLLRSNIHVCDKEAHLNATHNFNSKSPPPPKKKSYPICNKFEGQGASPPLLPHPTHKYNSPIYSQYHFCSYFEGHSNKWMLNPLSSTLNFKIEFIKQNIHKP